MHIRRKGKRKKKRENSFFLISLPTLKSLMATNLQGCLTIKIEKGDIGIPVSSCKMFYIYIYFLPFFFLFRILRHAIASETLTILSM